MRAVFDSNVLIAAYVTEGLCSRLLHRALLRQFDLIISPLILKEFRRNIQRLTTPLPEVLRAAVYQLEAIAISVTPVPSLVPKICRDPADNAILGCALTARADFLVTGDRDLLDLHTYRNIPILSPRDFEAHFPD
jgi:putative PIN family toxin of toxin-antitoxin system